MLSKLKKSNQGFTIIEVLIVLAIAGLILLIVFLAVPALQRNSRNTSRRNDVAKMFGGVQEYIDNNNGQLPTANGDFNTVFTQANVKFGFYTQAGQATYNYSANRTAVPAAPPTTSANTVVLYNFLKCNGNTATLNGASPRSVAALFNIEGSGTGVAQCQES